MKAGTVTGAQNTPASRRPRIVALDLARSAALLAMAVFHFVFDLEMFGFLPRGTVFLPGWRWLAFLTAGSFLFLVGVGLWLGHGAGMRLAGFARRLVWIVAAAAAITVATYIAMPGQFVFFGILHAIAVSSVMGLVMLRLPAGGLVVAGCAVLALPQWLRFDALSAPWFWWLGLQTSPIQSVDFVPIFPWFGPVLFGIAVAKWGTRRGVWSRISRRRPAPWVRALSWPGRHSLFVYLIHQPILITIVWAAAQLLR